MPPPPSIAEKSHDYETAPLIHTPTTPTLSASPAKYGSRPQSYQNDAMALEEPENKETIQLVARAMKASLVVNIMLLGVKLTAFIVSGSLAVLATVVDSLLDLTSQLVLYWAENRATKEDNRVLYPAGQSRLAPLGIVVCACLMTLASAEVIRESCASFYAYYTYYALPQLLIDRAVVLTLVLAVVSKFCLFLVCRAIAKQTGSDSVRTLAMDHVNDVLSISLALLALLIISWRARFWWVDPAFAIFISIVIITNWFRLATEQVEMIAGRTADPDFIESIRQIVVNHHPSVEPDIIRAYHFGPDFLVEVEVLLPGELRVVEAHDIALSLQQKIEAVDRVERAFVHVDYAKRAYDEHYARSWKGKQEWQK